MRSELESDKYKAYLHGYSIEEGVRLLRQNQRLSAFIYEKLDFSRIYNLIEIGCGVGAQMIYLLKKYSHLHLTGVDISSAQLITAEQNLLRENIPNSRFELIQTKSDGIFSQKIKYDAVLIVWVLEHLTNPQEVINNAYKILRPRGKIFITEVCNDSLCLLPSMDGVLKYWKAINEWQTAHDEDPNIGMKLGTYLNKSSFVNICKWTYPMFFDSNEVAERQSQFDYWYELMKSAEEQLILGNFITKQEVEKFESEWKHLIGNQDAIFYYHFAQATAEKLREDF